MCVRLYCLSSQAPHKIHTSLTSTAGCVNPGLWALHCHVCMYMCDRYEYTLTLCLFRLAVSSFWCKQSLSKVSNPSNPDDRPVIRAESISANITSRISSKHREENCCSPSAPHLYSSHIVWHTTVPGQSHSPYSRHSQASVILYTLVITWS